MVTTPRKRTTIAVQSRSKSKAHLADAMPSRYLISVDEYERMGTAGVFAPDIRIELIEGELLEMAPIEGPHFWGVMRLDRRLQRLLGDTAWVAVQSSVRLPRSMPEPDMVILRPTVRENEIPTAADILLVIEVSDSSVRYDRNVKGPLYAGADIIEYWMFDVPGEAISVHTDPTPTGYGRVTTYRRGEQAVSIALPTLTISVDEALGVTKRR